MNNLPSFYYLFCNHWTQGGIGFAFPAGWIGNRKYEKTFSSVYTIQKMLDAADDFPGLKVSMELDAYLYEEVAKEDPACIDRLKAYIRAGKAGIEGGTYGQPFGQDYGWEPNVRQLTFGRKSIRETLAAEVCAFLVEEQWFHPQLPQLLRQAGFRYASLQNQNSGQVMPMNEALIHWRGIDGTGIPAIPANNLQISCVRQYTDYTDFRGRLADYERPLLFQWVEIWPPGMDWGASAQPFKEAIRQVMEWGGRPSTLQDFFEAEADREHVPEVYIPLDRSNYANNWYQGGGWGYGGDRIIQADKRAERSLLSWETLSAWNGLLHGESMDESLWNQEWKKLMVLQNHDFSVARSYRAVTEEGLVTTADSYGIMEYEHMILRLEARNYDLAKLRLGGRAGFVNPLGVPFRRTIELPPEATAMAENGALRIGSRVAAVQQVDAGGRTRVLATVDLPAFGLAACESADAAEAPVAKPEDAINVWETGFEDKRYRVEWIHDSWCVHIQDKVQDTGWTVKGFTGPIGKVNEHDGQLYHALSSAHKQFTFAFEGTTHSPDQLAWISAKVEESGPIRTTLCLRSDLLTLHTTQTPVAFAEARVSVYHETGLIEFHHHLYTGVYLQLQCWAEFSYELINAEVYRDFPFGEEATGITDLYPNTYMRLTNGKQGFGLMHTGTPRVILEQSGNGGTIRHLQARDRVLGDYEWRFVLMPGHREPWECAALSQVLTTDLVFAGSSEQQSQPTEAKFDSLQEESPLIETNCPRVIPSAFYLSGSRAVLRVVNYSTEPADGITMKLNYPFRSAAICDLEGNELEGVDLLQDGVGAVLQQNFKPWEIRTFVLDRGK